MRPLSEAKELLQTLRRVRCYNPSRRPDVGAKITDDHVDEAAAASRSPLWLLAQRMHASQSAAPHRLKLTVGLTHDYKLLPKYFHLAV